MKCDVIFGGGENFLQEVLSSPAPLTLSRNFELGYDFVFYISAWVEQDK